MPVRDGAFAKTRTTIPTVLDRLFLVPKNVGYHLEHHLYPSVPFYKLPMLHKLLMKGPIYHDAAHVTRGYWRMLRECMAV
jgi:fatty acid desaturase